MSKASTIVLVAVDIFQLADQKAFMGAAPIALSISSLSSVLEMLYSFLSEPFMLIKV